MGKVLILCEFSGIVREAFSKNGHDAWSCDLLPTEILGQHFEEDFTSVDSEILKMDWDLIIAHPPCTDLAVSGARYFPAKRSDGRQQRSIEFFMKIADLPYERIAIENPISIMSTTWRKPDQIIQPWQFGHGETKATCLWLKGLPKLKPTDIVDGRENRIHKMPPGKNRWKERSRTYTGIAKAMADQWGCLI